MSTADGRAWVCRDRMTFGSMPFETKTTDVRLVIATRGDAMATVRGTCEEMCPAREREARAASGEVHALERGDAMTSVVKRYRRTVRSGSDDAVNVRTIDALERSVNRVLDAVARVARGEESACAMSSSRAFADDRLRAVRQDLSIQGIFAEDPDACARAGALLERMVAYAVVSERERRSGLNGACDFGEARLRDEQLGKTFGMLFSVFRELGADRVDPRRVGRAFSLFACSTARDAPVSSSASVSSSSELVGDLRRAIRITMSARAARGKYTTRLQARRVRGVFLRARVLSRTTLSRPARRSAAVDERVDERHTDVAGRARARVALRRRARRRDVRKGVWVERGRRDAERLVSNASVYVSEFASSGRRRETSRAVVLRGRQARSTDRRASAAQHFHPSRVVDREDVRDTDAIDIA